MRLYLRRVFVGRSVSTIPLGALHYGITLRIRGPNVVDTNHWGAAIDDRGLK